MNDPSYVAAVFVGAIGMTFGLAGFVWLLSMDRRSRRAYRNAGRRLELESAQYLPVTCTRPELGHDGPCNGLPSATCWQHISVCPRDVVVLTKIDDEEHGARNVDTPMMFSDSGPFFLSCGYSRPAYYQPTHFRLKRSK